MTPEATVLYDPTSELAPSLKSRLRPTKPLAGRTVALLDLGKIRSDEFLDHVDRLLSDRGLDVQRFAKPTNAKPAPLEVVQQIAARADVVVEALAD